MKKLLSYFLVLAFAVACNDQSTSQLKELPDLTKEQALQDFDQAVHLIQALYGPLEFKERLESVELDVETHISETRSAIESIYQDDNLKNDLQFNGEMRKFIAGFKDAHASFRPSVSGYEMKLYTLPITLVPVKRGDDWLAVVDEVKDDAANLGISKGDIVVAVDGKTPAEYLEIFTQYYTLANDESDRHLIRNIFKRSSDVHETIPESELARIEYASLNADGEVGPSKTTEHPWTVKADSDRALIETTVDTPAYAKELTLTKPEAPLSKMGAKEPYFYSEQAISKLGIIEQGAPATSVLEKFGLTSETYVSIFHATYQHEGRNILLVRQPGYSLGEAEDFLGSSDLRFIENIRRHVQSYKAVLFAHQNADVLVLDQTHNPGGSVWYCLDFFRIFISQDSYNMVQMHNVDRSWMADLVEQSKNFETLEMPDEARRSIAGARMIENSAERGDVLSPAMPFVQGNYLKPYTDFTWDKPMLVLADELAASGGDAFPMMVKANKRAKLFGNRTMGAGGNVVKYKLFHSNSAISLTRGLFSAYSPDHNYADETLVENNGVTPDILQRISVEDVRDGYIDYIKAFSKSAVEQIEISR